MTQLHEARYVFLILLVLFALCALIFGKKKTDE